MNRNLLAVLLVTISTGAGAADTIEPGLYEIVTRNSVGGPETRKQCMTAADIARGFQSGDLGKDCKSVRSVASGGKLDFLTTCPGMTMTTKGTYTATGYVIDGKVQIKADGEAMDIDTHITGRKIAAAC